MNAWDQNTFLPILNYFQYNERCSHDYPFSLRSVYIVTNFIPSPLFIHLLFNGWALVPVKERFVCPVLITVVLFWSSSYNRGFILIQFL